MKPLIGVTPLYDTKEGIYQMSDSYIEALEQAGAIPVILSITQSKEDMKEIVDKLDGLLFTGGQDIDPSLYGENKGEKCGDISKERDDMEAALLEAVFEADKPMLGISRGMELLNVHLGGKLYQDIETEHEGCQSHMQEPPYSENNHGVIVISDTPLAAAIPETMVKVSCRHHQGIKEISKKLEPMALSTDGIIEAVYKEDSYFVWAIQWRPDLTFKDDENSKKIFEAFVQACKLQNLFKK